MSRNVISRAERHKQKEQKQENESGPQTDIEIIPATAEKSDRKEPKTEQTKEPASLADKKKAQIDHHKQKAVEYYHTHKEAILNRLKEKRLEKRRIRTEKALKEIEQKEQLSDDKKLKKGDQNAA